MVLDSPDTTSFPDTCMWIAITGWLKKHMNRIIENKWIESEELIAKMKSAWEIEYEEAIHFFKTVCTCHFFDHPY